MNKNARVIYFGNVVFSPAEGASSGGPSGFSTDPNRLYNYLVRSINHVTGICGDEILTLTKYDYTNGTVQFNDVLRQVIEPEDTEAARFDYTQREGEQL